MADHHPDLPRASEWHRDERSEGYFEALRNAEIEGLVEGHVESDAGYFHAPETGPKSLWISL
jgi:hypothetical protein